ncbi:MAG: hypothetical protein KAV00_01875 [Phycisphaerae bacterium]|nr:hypothetical protein [Phycisphaerae bacterium]
MAPPQNENGWNEWQRHILAELKRMNEWLVSIQRRLDEVRLETAKEIAVLKVKAGIWGATAGALVLLLSYLVSVVKGL